MRQCTAVVDTIRLKDNTFVTGVKIKATDESKCNASPAVHLDYPIPLTISSLSVSRCSSWTLFFSAISAMFPRSPAPFNRLTTELAKSFAIAF